MRLRLRKCVGHCELRATVYVVCDMVGAERGCSLACAAFALYRGGIVMLPNRGSALRGSREKMTKRLEFLGGSGWLKRLWF